jgi:hypothetical protein
MHAHIQESPPASPTKSVRNPNTGFPEPLCPGRFSLLLNLTSNGERTETNKRTKDRNTTLPHPDADTSLNATIEADDLVLVKTRSRSGFHRHRNSKVNSSGKISPEDSGLYNNIQYADGSREKKSVKEIQEEVEGREDIVKAPLNVVVKNISNGRPATPTEDRELKGRDSAVSGLTTPTGAAPNGLQISPSGSRGSSGSSREREKKGGFFRRLHSHRHKS